MKLQSSTQSQEPVSERWGEATAAGFAAVPNVLIRSQAKLGLTPNDVVVLLNLLVHWWSRDRQPYPRSSTIAQRSGLTVRTVQRSLQRLAKRKLVTKERVGGRERYNLAGLVHILGEHARSDPWFREDRLAPPRTGA